MAKKDRKASDILSALARLSDAPDPIAGRDTVSGTVRVFHDADSSRRLNVDVVRSDISGADRCVLLSAGGNKISLRLRCTGAFVVSFGEAIFEAADRTAGAGFVDEISRWLATPLVPAAQLPNRSEPPILLQGSYAELGAFRRWRRRAVASIQNLR